MDIATIQRALLSQYGLRIDPAMGEYILSRLPGTGMLPVIGGQARTGVPSRLMIDLQKINSLLATDGARIGTDVNTRE